MDTNRSRSGSSLRLADVGALCMGAAVTIFMALGPACGTAVPHARAGADDGPKDVMDTRAAGKDRTPPAAVTNFQVVGNATWCSITVTFTATGDDGDVGTADFYDIRYVANGVISEENWETASRAVGEPRPQPAGTTEEFEVGFDLLPAMQFSMAMKVADEDHLPSKPGYREPLYSPLSNVVTPIISGTGQPEPPCQAAKLTASDAAEIDYLGGAVAIDGDTIVVGAQGVDDDAGVEVGSAYVFRRDGDGWTETKLAPSGAVLDEWGGRFGNSVSISGNLILVGDKRDDEFQQDSGAGTANQIPLDQNIRAPRPNGDTCFKPLEH